MVNARADTPMALTLFDAAADAPLPERETLASRIRAQRFAAGATVFEQGVAHPYLHVVRSGLVKLCYLRDDGSLWIKSFAEEGRYFGSIAALQEGGRTSFLAQTVEDGIIERIALADLERLAVRHLAWANALRSLTMRFAARKEARERELLTLSREANYRAFIADNPVLARRIPQKDLAAYLGVTPVGLNRIAMRVRRDDAKDPARPEHSRRPARHPA